MKLKTKARGIGLFVIGLLILTNLMCIFLNSSQTAASSNKVSKSLVRVVAPAVVSDYKEMTPTEQITAVSELNNVIREYAHSVEFVPLGFLTTLFLLVWQDKVKKAYTLALFAVGVCMLYGLSDELHQTFVDGRSFQLTDIYMDTAGGLAGAILAYLLLLFIRLRQLGRMRKSATQDS